jgi:hypothetical protein
MECPRCNKTTEHVHLHNAAHGMPETHMDGSERYECKECGYAMYAMEGEKQGLLYLLDGELARKKGNERPDSLQ